MPVLTVTIVILLVGMYASYAAGKLTMGGALTGGGIAFVISMAMGYTGLGMLGFFFLSAVLATSHKKQQKRALTDKGHQQKRDAWQVLANGGMAAFAGLQMLFIPFAADLFAVLLATALASATADTLSSELGTVYGKRFYNIITFKPDEKGRDGVISVEGLLIGLAGSAAVAVIFYIGFVSEIRSCIYIVIGGTIGNLSDSILGATLERKGKLGNNAVNFLNTFIAALAAFILTVLT